ncbi:hypothetical protein OG906_37700 (plasmid) [Streptomyces sp. NBC_01426]|uniref:hypothetical protein n=1 Tax=Streptomyces sp. NBC_01426 TaxID=2975866 RepID=UPI002E3196BF|nr:hypothetical protein [Streptomyces sp. NBC_01426]
MIVIVIVFVIAAGASAVTPEAVNERVPLTGLRDSAVVTAPAWRYPRPPLILKGVVA